MKISAVFILFTGLFAIFSFSAVAFADQNYRQRIAHYEERYDNLDDIQAEIAFGREVAAHLLGRYGTYDDQQLNRYLALVGKGLALHSGRPELEFHFAVLDTEERNAFAAPGGYIFVTRGALASMTDENELAAVLAHEIAHITERHIVRELKLHGTKAQEGAVFSSLIGGMTDPVRVAFSQMVDKAIEILVERGYRQQDEADADQIGTTLTAMVGYDSHALTRYLDLLSSASPAVASAKIGTHPPNSERVANLKQFIQENGLPEKPSSILKERYAKHVHIQ